MNFLFSLIPNSLTDQWTVSDQHQTTQKTVRTIKIPSFPNIKYIRDTIILVKEINVLLIE